MQAAGQVLHYPEKHVLFHTGDANVGVFLVVKGVVSLQLENIPKLDRFFEAGSLLGLPATFTGNPYSLTAVCVTACQVVQVSRDDFIRLMQEKPELCQEAAAMLSEEVAFIQSAVAERMHAVAVH